MKRWVIGQPDGEAASRLAEECGIAPFLALMLSARGVKTAAEAEDLLNGGAWSDPYDFADMDVAVERIQRAIDGGERITVFGDYDADGLTATALLYSYLRSQGGDVTYRIPCREGVGEGSGLSCAAVEQIAAQGTRLLITVDNGITAVAEVARAGELGMDVVVTDHHIPQSELPAAVAVVDPWRQDCPSTYKTLAGVGVAFKLVCALDGDPDVIMENYGDLLALGTLADVMPLRGENRTLVRQGLEVLNRGDRPGLVKLAEAAGIGDRPNTAQSLVFTLSPRINAAGRMGDPGCAEALLLTEDEQEAERLAATVHALNAERQTVEARILDEIMAQLDRDPTPLYRRVLVIEGEGWHRGVMGILAARIAEKFGKPCLILSVQDGIAKGSGRSLKGFSLFDALAACADLLTTFGGHELAAGVTLTEDNIGAFRDRINAWAAEHHPVMPVPELALDFRLRPSQIDVDKIDLLDALEPYGADNPLPVFGLFDMRLDGVTPVGGGRHLRLSLSRDDAQVTAMLFGVSAEEFPVPCGAVLNAAVTLSRNEFRGTVTPSIQIRDLRYADTDQEVLLAQHAVFDRLMDTAASDDDRPTVVPPAREQIAAVYRALRAAGEWRGTAEQLWHRIGVGAVDVLTVRIALEVLRQAGLIEVRDHGTVLHIRLLPVEGKADLTETPLMRRLTASME